MALADTEALSRDVARIFLARALLKSARYLLCEATAADPTFDQTSGSQSAEAANDPPANLIEPDISLS